VYRLCLLFWLCVTTIATQAVAAPPPDATCAKMWGAFIDAYAANGDFSGVMLVTRHGEPIF
jgi:hypothetical protein